MTPKSSPERFGGLADSFKKFEFLDDAFAVSDGIEVTPGDSSTNGLRPLQELAPYGIATFQRFPRRLGPVPQPVSMRIRRAELDTGCEGLFNGLENRPRLWHRIGSDPLLQDAK